MSDQQFTSRTPLSELEDKYLKIDPTTAVSSDVAGPRGTQPTGWSSKDVFVSSSMILLFGFFLFCIMAVLVAKKHHAMDVIRLCSLPLIIVSAIFLVVVGYSAEQIAPVMGLLGSIAGYLLGAASKESMATKVDTSNVSALPPPPADGI